MIARMMTAAAVSALLLGAAPAIAQEVERDAIEAKNLEKGKQSISAERAYIFVSGPARSNGLFYKTPTEEDLKIARTILENFKQLKKSGDLHHFSTMVTTCPETNGPSTLCLVPDGQLTVIRSTVGFSPSPK